MEFRSIGLLVVAIILAGLGVVEWLLNPLDYALEDRAARAESSRLGSVCMYQLT